MKILVSCIGYDSGKSGISVYMKSVVKQLGESGEDITLLVEPDALEAFKNYKKIVMPKLFSRAWASFFWHIFATAHYGKSRKFDCTLVLAGNRRFSPFSAIPTVGVVHDLSYYNVAAKYDKVRMFYLTKIQPLLGRKFSSAAAISNSTLDDVLKFWHFDKTKIFLDYNGTDELSKSPDFSILQKLKIEKGKYIHYVSRLEHPGKNHVALIEAFEKINGDFKLVLTGADWNGAETVKQRAKQSPKRDDIIFSGFVSKDELSALHQNAAVFVMPSLYEGFGLPLVEAMRCGIPCACSNLSSLKEIGLGAAELFDPKTPTDIARAIKNILNDKIHAESLVALGKERAKLFDWKRHTELLLKACHQVTNNSDTLEIFDIKFKNGRMGDVANDLIKSAEKRIKTTVAFVNTFYLNTAYEDAEQSQRLKNFDMVLPDGSGVSLACRLLGLPYRDNLNGTDLTPILCKLAATKNLGFYLLGGKEGVAKLAAENLKKMVQNLKISGTRNGYFNDNQTCEIIDEINAASPDFVLVGLGVRLQEKWTLENADKINAPIIIAVGGLVDTQSGIRFRVSPKFRKLGLEWVGKFLQEPRRLFKRYAIGNPLFILRVIKYKFSGISLKTKSR